MAAITASLVKELRDKTGAGMMDCKKALTENDGDIEAAVDWLRKKGLAAAAKKAGRAATEGLVAVVTEGNSGAMVEVNAETDFVARNESFQGFVETVAGIALSEGGDMDKVSAAAYPGGEGSVADTLTKMIGSIGENMSLRRTAGMRVDSGVVGSYVHNTLKPGLGKIGILVGLESTADASALQALGKQIAMHVAATSPQSVSRDELDSAVVERERNVLIEQARASGKPENIIEKMVEGRLRKFYEEVCLLDQTFVIDGESRVGNVIDQAAKDLGAPVKITGFLRFALGEGLAKKEEDYAAEVAALAGQG